MSTIWRYSNSTKVILYPKKAYDPCLRTAKQLMRDVKPFRDEWQPESLYFKFTSEEGCTFDFSWFFESEEKAIYTKSNDRANQKDLVNKMRAKWMNKVTDYWEKNNGHELASKDLKNAKLSQKRREYEERDRRNLMMEQKGVKPKKYLTLNGERAADWIQENAKRMATLRESRLTLARSVQEKKQRIEDHKLTMNILRLSKWDFVRKNQEKLKQENEEFSQQI